MANRNTAKTDAEDATTRGADAAKDAVSRTQSAANDAMDKTVGASAEAASRVESYMADTQKSMQEQFGKFSRGFEGLTTFNQENLDAFVKSSEIAAKAAEGIGSELSAYSKRAFEDSVAAAQDIAGAKTVTELFERQTAYAQNALEGWMSQATKLNEIYIAAAKDISAPFGERVSRASETFRGFAA